MEFLFFKTSVRIFFMTIFSPVRFLSYQYLNILRVFCVAKCSIMWNIEYQDISAFSWQIISDVLNRCGFCVLLLSDVIVFLLTCSNYVNTQIFLVMTAMGILQNIFDQI